MNRIMQTTAKKTQTVVYPIEINRPETNTIKARFA